MHFIEKIEESFDYGKRTLWDNWGAWLLLIVMSILFPFYYGYLIRVLRGENEPPKLTSWWSMFVDGIKAIVISIVYSIPLIIIGVVFFLLPFISIMKRPVNYLLHPFELMGFLSSIFIGLILFAILLFIIILFLSIGIVHFARNGSITKAFAFGEIVRRIEKIGWIRYIASLIGIFAITSVILCISTAIQPLAIFLSIILMPFVGIFKARYISLLYDEGENLPV